MTEAGFVHDSMRGSKAGHIDRGRSSLTNRNVFSRADCQILYSAAGFRAGPTYGYVFVASDDPAAQKVQHYGLSLADILFYGGN
jgi:hypothetical protein